jgi:hypothetical protein
MDDDALWPEFKRASTAEIRSLVESLALTYSKDRH